jgi:hypothetical protein
MNVTAYGSESPWYKTEITRDYLGILTIRPVSAELDDFLYTLESQYAYRPDLLSYDLYGTPNLWWVFMQRNLDILQDPIFDFVPGVQFYIPKSNSLMQVLGN